MALSVVKADKFLPLCGTGPETPKLIEKKRQEKTYIFFYCTQTTLKVPYFTTSLTSYQRSQSPDKVGLLMLQLKYPSNNVFLYLKLPILHTFLENSRPELEEGALPT